MKTETLLNAMERADFERLWEEPQSARIRRRRQYRTFRAAILARDEEQRERIAELEAEVEYWRDGNNGAIRESHD